ncbi:MAG: efflux RND transporter periplasmic adaptor subunit [Fuerstiella sp.]
MPAADSATVDLTRTCVRLRQDVRFTPQVYRGENFYHLELRSTGAFYRIGYVEYVFLSLLDGTTSFCEALALTARALGPAALPQEQALSVYTWAIERQVVSFAGSEEGSGADKGAAPAAANPLQKFNPFWIQIPLGRPEPVLRLLQPLLGWLFSPWATACGLGFMLAAAVRLSADWDRFSVAAENVFARENWIWLLVAWILLKTLHELGHGLVCRRYGGTVRQTGIIVAFFAPLAYVDVTSCWAFRSRWQRIHTAAAGMYTELLLASAAVFLWTHFHSHVAAHLLHNVILMASVSTILFNANPLMRFDGYYILSDLLQIPNLYTQSGETLRQAVGQMLTGISSSVPAVAGSQRRVLLTYGIAAFAWRMFICLTMILAASVLFHGAGVVLSAVAVCAWFAMPLLHVVRSGYRLYRNTPARFVRAATVCVVSAVAVWAAAVCTPVPFSTVAPGMVSLPDGRFARVEVDGFVDDIHVVDGQSVQAGDLLVSLRNEEILLEHEDLLLQHQQETIRYQTALKDHDPGAARVAQGNLASLKQRLTETRTQVDALRIRAATSGVVVCRALDNLIGTYVEKGDELLIVDDSHPRELRVSVAQEDFAEVSSLIGQPTDVRVGSRPVLTGRLARVIPRASRRLQYPALAATEGGPLAVVPAGNDSSQDAELTAQRFEAVVHLAPETTQLVKPVGERGYIRLRSSHRSMGTWAIHEFRHWIRRQLTQTAAQVAG